jgi:hypothetical protein
VSVAASRRRYCLLAMFAINTSTKLNLRWYDYCRFCDITPCGPVEVYLHFGGKYRFHHQCRRASQTGKGKEVMSNGQLAACLAYSSAIKKRII